MTATETDDAVSQRSRRVLLERVALGISCTTLGLLLGVLTYRIVIEPPWAPLGSYPTQDVASDQLVEWEKQGEATYEIPAIIVGDELHIAGTKCADEEVVIRGLVSWTPINPPGPSFDGGSGTAVRVEGCETFQFVNDPPPAVVEWAEDVLADGNLPVMRLGGVETPNRDGSEGVSRVWQSEPFAFVEAD